MQFTVYGKKEIKISVIDIFRFIMGTLDPNDIHNINLYDNKTIIPGKMVEIAGLLLMEYELNETKKRDICDFKGANIYQIISKFRGPFTPDNPLNMSYELNHNGIFVTKNTQTHPDTEEITGSQDITYKLTREQKPFKVPYLGDIKVSLNLEDEKIVTARSYFKDYLNSFHSGFFKSFDKAFVSALASYAIAEAFKGNKAFLDIDPAKMWAYTSINTTFGDAELGKNLEFYVTMPDEPDKRLTSIRVHALSEKGPLLFSQANLGLANRPAYMQRT